MKSIHSKLAPHHPACCRSSQLLPADGFINGLDFPTMADLAVLIITKGCMPFQAASTMAGVAFDPVMYPKMERTREVRCEHSFSPCGVVLF